MLDFATTAFISVLFLVDPPATIPAFMALTASFSPARQRRTALVAAVAATVALMGFAAIGKILFQALGLTLPAFQIAGGLVLFVTSFKMINADSHDEKSGDMNDAREQLAETPPEPKDGPVSQIAITPLAIPFLAGPAAMSTVTVLMSQADSTAKVGFVYLAIALTGVLCYVCLRLAGPIQKRMGKIGIHVLERVLGLVLAGIAVQFVLNGLVSAGVLPPLKS
jgi:multiple antibiotic resistance protein